MFNLNVFCNTVCNLEPEEIIKTLHLEKEVDLYNKGYDYIFGFDEVGRGAWVGDIVVGCTVLPFFILRQELCSEKVFFNALYHWLGNVKDSKKLTQKKRESLIFNIEENTMSSYGATSANMIDMFGITLATQSSMNKAFLNTIDRINSEKTIMAEMPNPNKQNSVIISDYGLSSDFAQISGIRAFQFIHGEDVSLSIAAASIVAKVHRDNTMKEMHLKYPEYDFEKNKGYHSKNHVNALKLHGRLSEHRARYGEISIYPLRNPI